ncbi:HupE/UreJ family protein [Vibrio breoganii]|uniref:HupE/UreJ family protein n=1 Tax=Vibrio breoganii TaxID=553239 RepID=UPI000C82B2BA|nr:HupE/UreJ family protein [Vibrio breoganii]PMO32027.1 hypothetical protein BCT12_17000 [Vibrio breoganii]
MKKLLIGLLGLLPMSVFAHPEPLGHGLLSGIAHPLSGMDHFIAMFGIGIMAVALGGSNRWRFPLGFLVMMGLGAIVARNGVGIIHVESLIAMSVLLTGVALLSLNTQPTLAKVATTLAALFALFHGYVHVAEMQTHTGFSQYLSGMLVGSALIQLMGMFTVVMLSRFNMKAKGQKILGQLSLIVFALLLTA